jgi:hypothetical protein
MVVICAAARADAATSTKVPRCTVDTRCFHNRQIEAGTEPDDPPPKNKVREDQPPDSSIVIFPVDKGHFYYPFDSLQRHFHYPFDSCSTTSARPIGNRCAASNCPKPAFYSTKGFLRDGARVIIFRRRQDAGSFGDRNLGWPTSFDTNHGRD